MQQGVFTLSYTVEMHFLRALFYCVTYILTVHKRFFSNKFWGKTFHTVILFSFMCNTLCGYYVYIFEIITYILQNYIPAQQYCGIIFL